MGPRARPSLPGHTAPGWAMKPVLPGGSNGLWSAQLSPAGPQLPYRRRQRSQAPPDTRGSVALLATQKGFLSTRPPDPVPPCLSLQAAPGTPSPDTLGSRGESPSLPRGFPGPPAPGAPPAGTCPPEPTTGFPYPPQAGPEGRAERHPPGGPRPGCPGGLLPVPWRLRAPYADGPAEPARPGAGEGWGRACVPAT